VKLFSRRHGEEENALVILPGLLGSSANWQSIAKRLGQQRTVYTLDMRNHGQSEWSDEMNYSAMAGDVANFIASLDHNHTCVLGHSMGGKTAMRLAFDFPSHIDSLIIADVAPVTYDHDFNSLIQPMLALDLSNIKRRQQADTLLERAVANPDIRAFLLHNLNFNKNSERYEWRPNLEVLLNSMPEITGFELDSTEIFQKPALFIYGAHSDYITPENKQIISQHFSQSAFVELENAGHWLHAEQPQAFIETCTAFLSHDY
jgi:esterase